MKQLALLVVVLAFLTAPAQAVAAIYWGHDDSIGVANLDLSQRSDSINQGLRAWSTGLAVDSTHLYYDVATNEGSIGRANLDGSNADNNFIGGLDFPSGLAVTDSHIYWADRTADSVGKARLDGGGVQREFIAGAQYPCGVAVDGSHVYWSNLDGDSIGRARFDGSEVEPNFISGALRPCGLAVVGSQIYWTSIAPDPFQPGFIGRAALAGGGLENEFIPDVYEAFSLAANGTHLFWADEGWENVQGGDPTAGEPAAIGRARLDGTEVEKRWIGTVLAHGLAVDSRVLAPPPPPQPAASWYLRYGRVTHERSGVLRVVIFVPGPGDFSVDSKGVAWRISKLNVRPDFARWTLRLWPRKGTAGAQRIRRLLQRQGRAPFALRVTYQQEGHLPLESSKRLAFIRPAGH
jgi:hypothetical protein